MRDAESLLDQVLAYAGERLTEAAVREAVGLADEPTIAALLDALIIGDAPGALGRIASLADLGRDLGQVAAQAEVEARRRLLASAADPALARRLASVLRTLAEAAAAGTREGRARLMLELLAVDSHIEARPATAAPQSTSAPAVEAAPHVPDARPGRSTRPAVVAQSQAAPTPASPSRADPPAAASVAGSSLGVIQQRWPEVIERAAPAIKPLLRECRPAAVDGVRLTLAFPEERGFMRTKVTARSAAIEQLLGEVLGGTWAIECVASNLELEPLTIQQAVAPDPTNPADQIMLDKVLSITGGSWTDTPEAR
jgi:DNA polymerase-3 subunit gamma/tau